MSRLSRRSMLAGSTLAVAGGIGLANARAETTGAAKISLEEALKLRRSTRRFATDDLPEEQLIRLLWAANGVNRPDAGLKTAPTWHSANNIEIYVAYSAGVGRYSAADARIEPITSDDIRGSTSSTSFVNRAPVILIYISDNQKLAKAAGDIATQNPEELTIAAHVNAAIIAQNVYLFCAAEGLGTCLIGSADRAAITKALSLPEHLQVAYVQPVGRPR